MPTFTMPKSFNDVEQASPLPEGVYTFVSTKEVEVQENKAKTGMNLVVEIMTTGETDPVLNGRTFTKWMSLPNADDMTRRTKRGQLMADFKMEQIGRFVEAVGGRVDGANIEIPPQFTCRWAVIQRLNPQTQAIENELDGEALPA